MSSAGASAGPVAAAAAAQAKRRMEMEEEIMTNYNIEDMDKYEFKFVRSATGKFKNYQAVQQVCAEEAKAGWELLEKFDNYRLRFKRLKEKRAQDQYLQQDPYRTDYGMGQNQLGMTIAFTVLGLTGLLVAAVLLFK